MVHRVVELILLSLNKQQDNFQIMKNGNSWKTCNYNFLIDNQYKNKILRVTNFDGRTDEPVIGELEFVNLMGNGDHFFKLEFDLISYYKDQEVFFPKVNDYWLIINLRYFYFKPELIFNVKQSQRYEHFHVPLLCTPYSYNTYRGSWVNKFKYKVLVLYCIC